MANPNWVKGVSGNPGGRPVDSDSKMLREALVKIGKGYGKSFLEHCAERAFVSENMAIAILKKILPDRVIDDTPHDLDVGASERREKIKKFLESLC